MKNIKDVIIIQEAHLHLIKPTESRPIFVGTTDQFKRLSRCFECNKSLTEEEFFNSPGYCKTHKPI